LELEAFVKIFAVQIFWREQKYSDCLAVVQDLLEKITNANRRALDNYSSILYGYLSRVHEKNGD
jgi:hypothetical protein